MPHPKGCGILLMGEHYFTRIIDRFRAVLQGMLGLLIDAGGACIR
ncbi:MAG: hypothetical protein AB1750_12590 [Chloroflexota bacterium]